MKAETTIKGRKVSAKAWEGYGKQKIYFRIELGAGASAKKNQVEWDVQKGAFNYRTRESFLLSDAVNNIEAQEWEEALKESFELV